MDDALDPVAHELLMMEALDFRKITIEGPVDDVLDRAFLEFANFLNEGRDLEHPSVAGGRPREALARPVARLQGSVQRQLPAMHKRRLSALLAQER